MTSTPTNSVNPFGREAQSCGIRRWVPMINMVLRYKHAWIAKDIVAGLVLTTVMVPLGMGYAEAAGLPAIYGLYATIVPLVAYAIFGPSRILVLGPDSSLIAIIAATILPLAARHSDRAVELTSMLAILSGSLCILAGLARFGFVTDLLSKPVRYGYLNAIALTVLVGQLPKFFGLHVAGHDFLQESGNFIHDLFTQPINWNAFAIGIACLMVICASKRYLPKFPGVLSAVLGATIITTVFDLANKSGISVVGSLPQGLPALHFPDVSAQEMGTLLSGAIAIALVSFADMSVVSRTFAQRGGYQVDDNQELIALGAANVASGLFQGFCVSCSSSRTPVSESAGGKTQFACLVGALCVALLLIFAPDLLGNVPEAALAAVVISAVLSLVDIPGVCRLYRLRRTEFLSSMLCFLGVTLLGVIQGIFMAVGLSLLAFIWRAWSPYHAVLGRVDGLKGYHDVTRHPEARRIPGLVLFRWDAPLFFANARIFHECVLDAVANAPTTVRWVVVAAEPVTDIDITAADALAELQRELSTAGIELRFAAMKGPSKDKLKSYAQFMPVNSDNFFPTIGQAVDSYLEVHNVEWRDWDET